MKSYLHVLVFVLGLSAYYYLVPRSGTEIHLQGYCHPDFEAVKQAFAENLQKGWERDGGAFTLYHRGEKVVDIWGGYADRSSARLWKEDTLNVAFSCTKAISAVVMGTLVDRGLVSYEDLVSRFWPDFAQNGKKNATIDMVLSHMVGLPYTDEPITKETAQNRKKLARQFEQQKPLWPPGTAMGYHALTYGWLVDELVHRIDPQQRSVAQVFQQDIAQKMDLDVYIGLPVCQQHRMARITVPTALNILEEILHKPSDFNVRRTVYQMMFDGPLSKLGANVPWITFIRETSVNDPDLHRMEQPAVLGIATARAMAKLFDAFRLGNVVSNVTLQKMTSSYVSLADVISGVKVPRGKGLMIKEYTHNGKTHKLYGHSGYGGQNVRFDMENQVTFAYLSNGLKVGFGDTARTYTHLLEAVYNSLSQMKN